MSGQKLSELEAVVLGLIWTNGLCTAYSVRRTVQESLSAQWSGSAGAVYPVVRRLEEGGLIRSQDQTTGRRRSKGLEITPKGVRVLKAWLGPPVAREALAIPADPLRVRLRFLDLLPPEAQTEFLAEAVDEVNALITAIQADVRRTVATGGSPFAVAIARGALHATRAKLKTLTELQAKLDT